MPWILSLADDLTGALEVGAKFAGSGVSSLVTTTTPANGGPEAQVCVIDTETRHLGEKEAAAKVHAAASAMRAFAPWLVYKKTDSTLRGPIVAELRALLAVFPERPLVYAPAYPAMGRTVRDGQLLVHGVPVHKTAFGQDPLNPVLSSDLASLLRGLPVTLVDGESTDDVLAFARRVAASDKPALLAGPAALAEALAGCVPFARRIVPPLPRLTSCLVVNGSLHPNSAAQIAYAHDHQLLGDGWKLFEYMNGGEGTDRAIRTGEAVRRTLAASPVDGIVVFGGDTAFGVHQALGSPSFQPCGEVLPGVPVSLAGGLCWITKAGGFGGPGMLCEIRSRLT